MKRKGSARRKVRRQKPRRLVKARRRARPRKVSRPRKVARSRKAAPRKSKPKKVKAKKIKPRKVAPHRVQALVPRVTNESEPQVVKQSVEMATSVHFEVIPPHPGFPLPVERLDWFMRCRVKEEIELAPWLNAAWKEKGDGIWLESLAIGDTVDWIEIAYGEEKVSQSLDIDYARFDDPAFLADFNQKFPIVLARIREYEQAAGEVSRRRKVKLQLRRAGSKGILVFTLAVHFDSPETEPALRSAVERNAEALRETYHKIQQTDG